MCPIFMLQPNDLGGRDVDGRASREVEAAELERPPIGVPGPAGNGVVDDRRPDEHEDHDGA